MRRPLLAEYKLEGSNISITGTEKRELERKHNIQPGTQEWFRLWFSRPYLTGETPIGENFADNKKSGRKELDPDVYEDLANSIIARIARQIVPTIRAKSTPEGYVYLSTPDGLSLVIGCNIAGGSVDINIGSQPMETTSSGPHKGAVTKIISAVYQAAVKRYGEPPEQGTLSIDHDAGHGVWQHIAQKLGLQYDAHMVKENFAEEFTNYQGLRPPKNVLGTNLFPGQDIVGQRVYHCTNRLEAIKKSGGLKPRRDATGEREYGRLSTNEHPFIPVIGIWFSVGKPDWPGKNCVSFVIEPTDQVYVAYASIKGLKPNVVLNPIALDRLTIEGQQDVKENFADGRNPQDKGDSKRHGINTKAGVSSLRKTAKQGGRKGQLAHWLANMKAGRAKKNK